MLTRGHFISEKGLRSRTNGKEHTKTMIFGTTDIIQPHLLFTTMKNIHPTALPFAEGDERRRHLAAILERAAAIPPAPATAGMNGSQARYSDGVGSGSTIDTPPPQREAAQRDVHARGRLRRALAASSSSQRPARAPPRTPLQEFDSADADAQELTPNDLETSLNGTYDYRAHAPNNDNDIGHWSAPELTTTSSLLLDADETGTDDRQLRAVLFRSLAVTALTPPLASHPQPIHHRDSLRRAIVRSHRELVRDRNDEFRRMVKVARTRVVDGQGDEVEASETAAEVSEAQGEEQTQLARIVLPPSSTSSMVPPPMAAEAPASAQEALSSLSRNDDQEPMDRTKAQGNAAVAGTAILPLARKDIKRAQAA